MTQEKQVLTGRVSEVDNLKSYIISLEERLRGASLESDELKRRLSELGDATKKNSEYEIRIKNITQEFEQSTRRIQ